MAADDDLSAPLGTARRPQRRLPDPAPILAAVSAAVLALLVVWSALIENPLGGEPIAIAQIERSHPAPSSPAAANAPKRPAAAVRAAVTDAPAAPADAAAAGPVIIKVPQGGPSSLPPSADPSLVESSKYGLIPKIAPDGRRPAEMFAATSVADAEDKRPKVAIMIGGLGVSGEATGRVLERLPRSITLGFTPYGDDLKSWVARARENGHEVMLQVPMEPFDYPNNDPGPQTLLTSLPAAANLDRLAWVMSRASGYFGLTNYMGAKFTASEDALAPVLTEAARRGLVFLDNGASPRSLVGRLGPETGASVARAELVIDATPDPAAIDAALARLEEQARRDGMAIGVASALPVTVERIEEWAGHLTAKGIALVPVSAVVKRSNPS